MVIYSIHFDYGCVFENGKQNRSSLGVHNIWLKGNYSEIIMHNSFYTVRIKLLNVADTYLGVLDVLIDRSDLFTYDKSPISTAKSLLTIRVL